MVAGKVLKEFQIEGKEVKIRYPEMNDLDELLETINSLTKEEARILRQEEIDRDEEVEWLSGALKDIEKGNKVLLIVEFNGSVMGSGSVDKKKGSKSHVGKFGISLKKDIRGKGIGSQLMETVIEEAVDRLGVEILVLDVSEKNEIAKKLYKKFGFEEVGRLKDGMQYKDQYEDTIMMKKDVSD